MRMSARIVLLVIAHGLAGCNGSGSSSAPSPVQQPVPPAAPLTYTLSGVVTTLTPTGVAPVAGVVVEGGRFRDERATTDANGMYRIPALYAITYSISASKWGYDTDARSLRIAGDTQLDIQLSRSPTYTLSGVVYEVTPTGQAPIAGAYVYCDACGEFGHTSTTTETNGFYSFPWVYNGVTPVIVTRPGYEYPAGTWTPTTTVNGHTNFNIQMVRQK